MRLAPGGLIAQTGAGGGIVDEAAATVDGGQRHEVEKAHAHAAHEHPLARTQAGNVLLDGVAGRNVGEAGLRERLLGRCGRGEYPAGGDNRGVGVDDRAVCEGDRVAVALGCEGNRAGLVLH